MTTTAGHRLELTRLLGAVCAFGCVALIGTDIAGILVYESYDPVSESISALAVGRYAWIQDLGLLLASVGFACFAGALLIFRPRGLRWIAGMVLAALLGMATFIIAFVNGYAGSQNQAADIHQWCVYLLFATAILTPLCLASPLSAEREWFHRYSIITGLGLLVLIPLYTVAPNAWDGAYERVLVLITLAWFVSASVLLIGHRDMTARRTRRSL